MGLREIKRSLKGQLQGSGSTSLPCKNQKRKKKQQKEEDERSPLNPKGSACNYYYWNFLPPFTTLSKIL